MASLRKVAKAKSRPYKERSQPESREHLGQLEKKKDYRLRAGDYNSKKARLKDLKKAALDRNPDEFYFHMVNSRLRAGEHHDLLKEPDEAETDAQRLLLACQDLRYVDFKISVEQQKVERLQASLHLMQPGSEGSSSAPAHQVNKHTFFVDDDEDAMNFDPAERFQTHPALIGRSFNRPKMSQLVSGLTKDDHGGLTNNDGPTTDASAVPKSVLRSVDKERKKQYRELIKRMERLRELRVVADKLRVRRDLVSNKKSGTAAPKRISKGTKDSAAIYQWPMERKK